MNLKRLCKNDEEDVVVKMEELIIKKDMEYRETIRKPVQKKPVHLMKHSYEKSIESHNEHRLNVHEQQSGIDDPEKVLEITAARTPKKRISQCL